ncbi:MAG: glycosyltransferase [Candidatus Omnitrophica bacterium]|nr:glycosyltransferase [Candidatus Omnitrophota bacterium]
MPDGNILVFIPTYNEAQNVRTIYGQLKALGLNFDILFLDDNSPDGTGAIIDELAVGDPRLSVIHRQGKRGIGSAHQDGIRWAYERGYATLITMDCDFSHSPEYIRNFLALSDQADIVVGSRYMEEGSLDQWNFYRKFLTYIGHFLTDVLLRMPYDATGAFRLYNLRQIPRGVFTLVRSSGYSFFFESLYIMFLNNFSVKEFPIKLPARTYGHSKMTLKGAMRSFMHLVRICIRTWTRRDSFIYSEPLPADFKMFHGTDNPYLSKGGLSPLKVQQDWDVYWNKERKSENVLYDLIAVFYRVFIIRRILDHFTRKHFIKDSMVLHAGCGSGQVDEGVARWVRLSALDISIKALEIYKKTNPTVRDITHGDIFNIPYSANEFDGVYNLGVMEHFTEEEIARILGEFNRVLKASGKMVILVPPENGLSVIFLKGVHYFLNDILKKKVQLHPPEISRPRNKTHARQIYEQHGLRMVDYYFGLMDVFTYAVIVLEKPDQSSGQVDKTNTTPVDQPKL